MKRYLLTIPKRLWFMASGFICLLAFGFGESSEEVESWSFDWWNEG